MAYSLLGTINSETSSLPILWFIEISIILRHRLDVSTMDAERGPSSEKLLSNGSNPLVSLSNFNDCPQSLVFVPGDGAECWLETGIKPEIAWAFSRISIRIIVARLVGTPRESSKQKRTWDMSSEIDQFGEQSLGILTKQCLQSL